MDVEPLEKRVVRRKPWIFIISAIQTVLTILVFWFLSALEGRSPYGAAALTSSLLGGLSQSIYQGLTGQFKPDRVAKFQVWGVFVGVWTKFWTDQLAHKYQDPYRKILWDQLLGNPFCVFLFTSFNAFWEGYNMDLYLQVNYKPAIKASLAIWPITAIIQFTIIPQHSIFIFNSVVTFFWNVILGLLSK